MQAYRDRLGRELSVWAAQKAKVDAAFTTAGERFGSIREAPEAERAALAASSRETLRAQIAAVLDPSQRAAFAAINAEIDARRAAQGGSGAGGAAAGAPGAVSGSGTARTEAKAETKADAKAETKADAKAETKAEPRPGGGGGQLAAFRQRLERELSVDLLPRRTALPHPPRHAQPATGIPVRVRQDRCPCHEPTITRSDNTGCYFAAPVPAPPLTRPAHRSGRKERP